MIEPKGVLALISGNCMPGATIFSASGQRDPVEYESIPIIFHELEQDNEPRSS
jgi:hypothetical protein